MSATDQHLDRARDALAEAGEAMNAGRPELAEFYTDVARVHAAIASAEEQRTANLIAFHDNDDFVAPAHLPVADGSAQKWWHRLATSIAERLDLA